MDQNSEVYKGFKIIKGPASAFIWDITYLFTVLGIHLEEKADDFDLETQIKESLIHSYQVLSNLKASRRPGTPGLREIRRTIDIITDRGISNYDLGWLREVGSSQVYQPLTFCSLGVLSKGLMSFYDPEVNAVVITFAAKRLAKIQITCLHEIAHSFLARISGDPQKLPIEYDWLRGSLDSFFGVESPREYGIDDVEMNCNDIAFYLAGEFVPTTCSDLGFSRERALLLEGIYEEYLKKVTLELKKVKLTGNEVSPLDLLRRKLDMIV